MDASITVTGAPPAGRRIYANRTLNLRAIKAIGYDMDYTLVHYRVEPWERRAYEHAARQAARAAAAGRRSSSSTTSWSSAA